MAVFGALAAKGKEPSAPRKIGIGMFIAALGFLIMVFGSLGLPTPDALKEGATFQRVTPNVLISTYLVLTFAELFLSPMGISFVSKVAPPKYKGMMMGLWFVATAIGNYMVSIIGMLWGGLPLWGTVVHPHRPLRHLRRLHFLHHEEVRERHQGLTAHSRIAYRSPQEIFSLRGFLLE